jgi:hypothetical protein
MEVLRVESSRLKEKWAAFYNSCSPEDTLDLATSEPAIEGVLAMVGQMQTAWESHRRGTWRDKAMRMFHKFCGGIDSHKTLLQILPQGSEYVSIFMGTVSVVIKVTRPLIRELYVDRVIDCLLGKCQP